MDFDLPGTRSVLQTIFFWEERENRTSDGVSFAGSGGIIFNARSGQLRVDTRSLPDVIEGLFWRRRKDQTTICGLGRWALMFDWPVRRGVELHSAEYRGIGSFHWNCDGFEVMFTKIYKLNNAFCHGKNYFFKLNKMC